MKKVLMSLFTIAIVGALIGGGVIAMFSDVETAPGTFTAGTIDIAIDGENPWVDSFTIEQAKPCQTWYLEFEITNVGNNPCVVWKHLKDFVTGGGIMVYPDPSTGPASSEPEYVAGGGTFNNGVPQDGYVEKCNIDDWIMYDLYSEVIWPKAGGGTDQWHQTLYTENVTIGSIECTFVPLGSIPPGGKMKVIQSYHLHATTPNDYQGDTLSFTIEFYAQQLEGTQLVMENKVKAQPGEPSVVQFGDGMVGYLDYQTVGSKFNYTFSATGLQAGTSYSLIYYADPWAGNHPGALIATFLTDGGGIASTSGSVNLNMDLPAVGDDNLLLGAKIWLVPTADYNAGTKSMTAYNEPLYLFETYLIWYNDTDV
jgi:predicted ribosomally synthesized peptide with SipW-like signal peptide